MWINLHYNRCWGVRLEWSLLMHQKVDMCGKCSHYLH